VLVAGVEHQFVTSGCTLSGLTAPIHIDSVWNHAQYVPATPFGWIGRADACAPTAAAW
jgi:hypothetical protein